MTSINRETGIRLDESPMLRLAQISYESIDIPLNQLKFVLSFFADIVRQLLLSQQS